MAKGMRVTIGGDIMPPESDIQFTIDFHEGHGSAARVFDIASGIVRAFEDLDRVLTSTVDSHISTDLIIEDVEKSSLKVWLRNVLQSSDDQAIKELNWKKLVGKYLLDAKYIALEWLDQSIAADGTVPIEDLTEKIRTLAERTDVRHLPDYPPLNRARLAQPLDAIQRTKAKFEEGERLTITLGSSEYTVDLKSRWLPSEHLPEAQSEQELSNDIDMVLVIRKPDFLGNSQWQFRHGKASLSAPIHDEEWVDEFRRGVHPIKPGDALRVRVRFEYSYNMNGDLEDQKVSIIKVYSIIQSAPPPRLFDD